MYPAPIARKYARNERTERSELVGSFEQRKDIALVADIALQRHCLAIFRLDRRDHGLRRRLVAGVADADPKPAARGSDGGGAADPAATAGDDGNSVSQDPVPRSM